MILGEEDRFFERKPLLEHPIPVMIWLSGERNGKERFQIEGKACGNGGEVASWTNKAYP